jgi:hypothetical protein
MTLLAVRPQIAAGYKVTLKEQMRLAISRYNRN